MVGGEFKIPEAGNDAALLPIAHRPEEHVPSHEQMAEEELSSYSQDTRPKLPQNSQRLIPRNWYPATTSPIAREAEEAYNNNELAHHAIRIEAEPGSVEPEILEALDEMGERWVDFWKEHTDGVSIDEMEHAIKDFFEPSFLARLSENDIRRLYELHVVADFFKQEGVEYENGARVTDLVMEPRRGDCNTLSIMALHMLKLVGVEDLKYVDVVEPRHGAIEIALDIGESVYFEGARHFSSSSFSYGTVGNNLFLQHPWQSISSIYQEKAFSCESKEFHESMLAYLQNAYAVSPNNAYIALEVCVAKATVLYESGNHEEAMDFLNELIVRNPSYRPARVLLDRLKSQQSQ